MLESFYKFFDEMGPSIMAAVICLIVTFVTNHLQNKYMEKRNMRKEAYDSFYLPFIALMYQSDVWYYNFSSLTDLIQTEFCKLIMGGICYMDEKVLDDVDVFYDCYLRETTGHEEPGRMDETFSYLVESVLKQADKLAKKLHQPRLGKHALSLFIQSADMRRQHLTNHNNKKE